MISVGFFSFKFFFCLDGVSWSLLPNAIAADKLSTSWISFLVGLLIRCCEDDDADVVETDDIVEALALSTRRFFMIQIHATKYTNRQYPNVTIMSGQPGSVVVD